MDQIIASVLLFLCVLGFSSFMLFVNKNTSHINKVRHFTWYMMWLGVGFMMAWFVVILNYTLKVING